MHGDECSDLVKADSIILMVGLRTFNSLRRKKDKVVEGRKRVRNMMRQMATIYMKFLKVYSEQNEVKLTEILNNAADMYRKETVLILGRAIDEHCEKEDEGNGCTSVTKQKSGAKVGLLNLFKNTGNMLIGHFLVESQDQRSNRVVEFLKVFKLFENELFGDAYYDLNYRRNRNL